MRRGIAYRMFPKSYKLDGCRAWFLEQAGIVTTEKVGRVRTCKLGLRRLEEEAAWIERYRRLWDARFDELDKIVAELKLEKVDGRKMRK